MKGTDPAFRDRFVDKIEKFARNLCPFCLSGFLQRLPGIEAAKIYQLECALDLISLLPRKPGATKADRI